MLILYIFIVIIGVYLNYLVINYLVNYPLNPSRISGKLGKKGKKGSKGLKGEFGKIGGYGEVGNAGPSGEDGDKGNIGVRGQLWKFGPTNHNCRNDPSCDWASPNSDWERYVNSDLKNNSSQISATYKYRKNSEYQDNLNDFRRGNNFSNNMINNEPMVQLRPCVTCNYCDPPAFWDSTL